MPFNFDYLLESKNTTCLFVSQGVPHSTLPDEQINWAFDTHPEERIIETTEKP